MNGSVHINVDGQDRYHVSGTELDKVPNSGQWTYHIEAEIPNVPVGTYEGTIELDTGYPMIQTHEIKAFTLVVDSNGGQSLTFEE